MVRFQMQEPYNRDFLANPLEEDRIEEPIIPINELGETVVETDPRTGANILQNIEASIRRGTSKMQLIWTTPSHSAIGGRPKAYGKEVREAIREVVEANEVEITGFEMPTSTNSNLSGFNPQNGQLSEEKRRMDLREIKDAIDFAAEVAGGGGIDIWSQEFNRTITDSEYINKDKNFKFYDYSEKDLEFEESLKKGEEYSDHRMESIKYLYDKRTNQIVTAIRKSSKIHTPKYMTAKDFEKSTLFSHDKVVGRWDPKKAEVTGDGRITEEDYVDVHGNWINPKDPNDLIKRVPKWNEEEGKQKFKRIEWDLKEIENQFKR